MKIIRVLTFLFVLTASLAWADEKKEAVKSNQVLSQELEVEKLKLELERLKLENERLQLKIQSLKMGLSETPVVENKEEKKEENKEAKKEENKTSKKSIPEMALKSEGLAKQNIDNEKTVVFDFSNGEIWHKGVRYSLNQFNHLCEDENWNVTREFVKFDTNGDTEYRYRHQNLSLERYRNSPKGVFFYEAMQKPGDFAFVTPEGITQDSTRGDIRNNFENPYLKFDNERKEKSWQVLRFKHGNAFMSLDDLLEFWLDKEGKIVRIKWGIMDKK